MMTVQPDSSVQPAQVVVVSLNPTFDLILEVDDFQVGRHQRGRELQRVPAGKGLNVSRTLDRLGLASIVTGFVGQESIGEFEQSLRDTRITSQFFAVPGRTPQNITIIDPCVGTDTHIRQQGVQISRQDLERMGKKLSLLAQKHKLVVFAGSLPPGFGPGDLARLLCICREAGAKVVLDSSGQALAVALSEGLWLIKPNRQEFADLTGQAEQSIEQMADTARELTDRLEYILISLGGQGAMLVSKQLALRADIHSAKPTELLNTVGSGDSLLGTFLAGLVQGRDLQGCLRRAVAASWAACQTSAPADFDLDLARSLQSEVRLQQLAR